MTVFESITSQNLPPVHVQKLHAVAQLAIYSELTAGLAPQLFVHKGTGYKAGIGLWNIGNGSSAQKTFVHKDDTAMKVSVPSPRGAHKASNSVIIALKTSISCFIRVVRWL